jgi:Secretion system C-terminal sorting domain
MPAGVSLLVAPNPAHGHAEVFFDIEASTAVSLQIVDILGEVVKAQNLGHYDPGQYASDLDTQGLAGGVYFVALHKSEGSASDRTQLFKFAFIP